MSKGRVENTTKNAISGLGYRLLSLITAFLVRTIFIRCLSTDYLSVSGLYSSIFNMLSLAELGFGTAMVYSMYEPLAYKDYEKLSQLLELYKKVYFIIGTIILIVGLCLIPFLDYLIKDKPDIEGLTIYYCLLLFNTVISYWFFAYRNSILQADQRNSIISVYSSVFNLIKSAVQIIVLLCFHSFLIYLLSQIGCTIAQNIAIAVKVKHDYPIFDKNKFNSKLPKEETKKIFKDVKALFLQKISFQILNTSDSIIISAFVGISWVGLISNYLMIEEAIVAVICQITSAVSASLGNYFATENKNDGYRIFKRIDFLTFWIYGFSSIALAALLTPFVSLWLGEEYTLSNGIVIALIIRFYFEQYINTMSVFKSSLGLFVQGQYLSPAVALLNIIISIALSHPFGAAGVILATPISRCCLNGWFMPYVIHREGFDKSPKKYIFGFCLRSAVVAFIAATMMFIVNTIISTGVIVYNFALCVVIVAIIPNAVFYILFHRTDEFMYFKSFVKNQLKYPRC